MSGNNSGNGSSSSSSNTRSTNDLRNAQLVSGSDRECNGEDVQGGHTLLGRLHQSSKMTSRTDLVSTGGGGPRFVKRSAALSEQSRYDAVGYPKSTRSEKSRSDKDIQQQQQQHPQKRLKGFQVRVINTHAGKTVVRAPILDGDNASSDKAPEDAPALPPLTAAELRYNAQRALINTTSVLRTAVGSKTVSRMASKHHMQAKPTSQRASIRGAGIGGAVAVPLTRALSDKGQVHRPMLLDDLVESREGDGFRIDMDFGSPHKSSGQTGRRVARDDASTGFRALHLGLSPELEQGRASTGSMLDQWGITAAAQLAQQKHLEQLALEQSRGHDTGETSDSDSAAEDTIRLVEDLARGNRPSLEAMASIVLFAADCAMAN
ncbi:hypothetical protein LPJ75_002748 [Coemansia sp. RSA 2598]|nr:hypothetical protein LPJ75_002748 [Coemansia sp. RSA 2598]